VFLHLDHPHYGKRGIDLDHLAYYYIPRAGGIHAVISAFTVHIPRGSDDEPKFLDAVKSKEMIVLDSPSDEHLPTFYVIVDHIAYYHPNGATQIDICFVGGRTISITDPEDRVTFLEHMRNIGK
jgi:hypothetical protein